jgi:hypothetical protein
LPELLPWQGPDREVDVTVEIGEAPPLSAPIFKTPIVEIDAEKRVRFGISGVADYRVEDGRRIVIAPRAPLDAPDIRLFLLGSGLGYLCHQRNALPIHAATVAIDGEAVLLTGASGAGKSTLASAFLRRGYPILSDDVSPLDLSGADPMILPSVQRLRLWSDSAANAGWRKEDLERCRAGLEKFTYRVFNGERPRALKPRAIVHLRVQTDKSGGSSILRLRGSLAAEEFKRQIYRWRSLVSLMGDGPARVRSALAATQVPLHFILERPLRYDALDPTVDDIVATVRASR